MTQKSGFWTTESDGDGTSKYTRSDWSEAAKILTACIGEEGVAPNYLSAFVGSVPGIETFRVAAGAALVDGKWMYSNANEDIAIPAASGGGNTRIDRIVLRANWTAQEVRIHRIVGTDAGSPTAPAITQTPGTTYDVKLYQVRVDTAGTVTVEVDERVIAHVTPAVIANRVRTFFVGGPYHNPNGHPNNNANMLDGESAYAHSPRFYVPADYVSDMIAQAVVWTTGSGNLYWSLLSSIGADGQSAAAHTDNLVDQVTALSSVTNKVLPALSLTSVAPGDFVQLTFRRRADEAQDTISANVTLFGFLVSYTADS